jgi:hypothetical protein
MTWQGRAFNCIWSCGDAWQYARLVFRCFHPTSLHLPQQCTSPTSQPPSPCATQASVRAASLLLSIVAGPPDPARRRAAAPNTPVTAGIPGTLVALLEDRWGNPTDLPEAGLLQAWVTTAGGSTLPLLQMVGALLGRWVSMCSGPAGMPPSAMHSPPECCLCTGRPGQGVWLAYLVRQLLQLTACTAAWGNQRHESHTLLISA